MSAISRSKKSSLDNTYNTLVKWSPAPESQFVDIPERSGLYIGGSFVDSSSDKWIKSTNPATGELLGLISDANSRDIARAVRSARKAFVPWAETPGVERGKALFRLARLVAERSRELAVLETLDG